MMKDAERGENERKANAERARAIESRVRVLNHRVDMYERASDALDLPTTDTEVSQLKRHVNRLIQVAQGEAAELVREYDRLTGALPEKE